MAPRERRDPFDTPEPEDPTKALLLEAKERFKRAQDWEGGVRKLYIDDVKFANGDSDNGWQWPDNVKEDRDQNNRPCLTVNRTKTIVNKLVNEAKKNPPEPRIKPVGEAASFEAAKVWQELIRHIQYVSNFAQVHGQAKENQLEGGIGYWHVCHDFVDQESFDQELRIEYLDPQYVFMDCDIKNPDGSDAMWGFIFDEYNRKEFHRLFPSVRIPTPRSPGLDDKDDWIRTDGVRVAQYYRIRITEDELIYLEDEEGNSWSGLKSDIPQRWRKDLKAFSEGKEGADYKSRKVNHRQLEWFKLCGSEIIDEDKDRRGQYIPIVRMPGRERKIEHRLHRAGIVRALKDPQRMYNYNTSGECEVVALQTKTPWITPAAAIEGNETAWARANTQNAAYLSFRHVDDEGEPIPAPTRAEAPTPAQGFLEGLRIAAMEMEMSSGIQLAQDTNPNIERTPKAINERVRSGEIINYDFVASEMLAVRHTAVILMDLAPHIYDTERVVQIMARDGTIQQIMINPDQEEVFIKNKPTKANDPMQVLFNPKIGKFAIEADVGPAYQTQREQAWDAFIEIIQAQPELMNIMGDLGFRAGDFPLAQEIAQRIKRNIEANMPWLLDDSQIGPLVKQLQSDNANLTQQLSELMEKLADQRGKTRTKEQLRDIEAQEADDNRLTTVVDALVKLHEIGIDERELRNLIHKTEHEMDHDWASLEVEKDNQSSMEQGDTVTESTSQAKGKTGSKTTKTKKTQKMVPRG
jgi:Phage P22-like portal protein